MKNRGHAWRGCGGRESRSRDRSGRRRSQVGGRAWSGCAVGGYGRHLAVWGVGAWGADPLELLVVAWMVVGGFAFMVGVCLVLLVAVCCWGPPPCGGSAPQLCLVDCLVGCRRLTVVVIVAVDCQKGSVLKLPADLPVCHM